MNDIKNAKAALRRRVLAMRDAIEPDARAAMSKATAEHAARLSIPAGAVVSGFLAIRSEIDPRPLLDHLAHRGARLCLPVVIDKQTIVFRAWRPGEPLVDAGFGTQGPAKDAPVVDPQWMIVPLSAFDERGGRLGYGAGHYDRAIARLAETGRRPILVGLAFSSQQVDRVPQNADDEPLDAVITEAGLMEFAPSMNEATA